MFLAILVWVVINCVDNIRVKVYVISMQRNTKSMSKHISKYDFKKNSKILYEAICQIIEFQLCFWFIPWLRVILNDVCIVNKKRRVIVCYVNEWISVFFWYQLLNIPVWYWYCWVPWLVWSMCIHDIEIGMRQVFLHEWYYLRPFLSLSWYKAGIVSGHMSLGRALVLIYQTNWVQEPMRDEGWKLWGQWLENEAKGGQQEIFMVPMMLPWRKRERSYEGFFFLFFCFFGSRREDFFAFFPCSYHVAYVFPWGSQRVPPKRSQ